MHCWKHTSELILPLKRPCKKEYYCSHLTDEDPEACALNPRITSRSKVEQGFPARQEIIAQLLQAAWERQEQGRAQQVTDSFLNLQK